MAVLTVDQARAGMVLAAPVTDRRGRLLIPAGNELSERHVEALRMWGVSHVEVEGDEPVEEVGGFDEEALAAAEAAVAERFREDEEDHPFLAALRAYAVRQAASALAKGGRAA